MVCHTEPVEVFNKPNTNDMKNILFIKDKVKLIKDISDFKAGEIYPIVDISNEMVYLGVPPERSFNIENEVPVSPYVVELYHRPFINFIKQLLIVTGIAKLK
jgi:hypothetical protein